MLDDTIAVRPDERFDEAKLAAYLRGRLPGSERSLAVRQFGGGAANLTYLLDFAGVEYVLRRPPLGPVAPSAHDMAREYRVLSVLHEGFPPAPRALLFCDDETIIGATFFVMERRRGVVVRRRLPPIFQTFPDAPRLMSTAVIDALAELHAVAFNELGLADLGRPQGFIERQIGGWYRRWRAAKAEPVPEMDRVYQWLSQNQPPSPPPTLVHNDYKLDNVMFAADDPGSVKAIFDWDMCTVGDPFSDLGALLTYWTEPGDPPFMQAIAATFMPVGDERFFTREQLVARYADRSGREPTHVGFYHVLGLFRVAVIIAQIYIRYLRGQTEDARFQEFGPLIALVARAAEERMAAAR